MVASAHNLSIHGAEAGGLLQVKGWPGLHNEFKLTIAGWKVPGQPELHNNTTSLKKYKNKKSIPLFIIHVTVLYYYDTLFQPSFVNKAVIEYIIF